MQKTALRARFSSEALTAMESSMGSSGGMTLVMIMVQFSSSLKRSRSGFCAARNSSGEYFDRGWLSPACQFMLPQSEEGPESLTSMKPSKRWKLHIGRKVAFCPRAKSQVAGVRTQDSNAPGGRSRGHMQRLPLQR